MGELLFRSGVVAIVLDAVTKWVAGLRGSLALVSVAAGTLFGTMSGSAVSGVAVLGSTWRRKCAGAATARRCRSGRSSAAVASP